MLIVLALQAAVSQTAPPVPSAQPTAPVVAVTDGYRGRANDVVRVLQGGDGYDTVFAPAFRAAVPKAQIDALAAQIAASLGKPTGVERIEAVTPWSGRIRIAYERGVLAADLVVDPAEPHAVVGLLLRGATPTSAEAASIESVIEQLKAFAGKSGFALARLGNDPPRTSAAHNPAQAIAIGSAFKLVILAELVRSIEAGERKWSDVVTLDGSALPGGGYAQQPKGTRVALRDLAERMISVSDNSATDILLFHLGREKVEAMLPVVGFTDGGARNVPFPGALELFKLKGVDGGALGSRYLALAPPARRSFLDNNVRDVPIAAIPRNLFQDKKPIRIGELEWFASPNDLIRAMDWLRRHMDGAAGTELRAILSKNPGLPDATKDWRYIGYKGGSEPGVLTMTFLLQAKDGGWYAMAAGVNDPASDVDSMKFIALMTRALELAAPR